MCIYMYRYIDIVIGIFVYMFICLFVCYMFLCLALASRVLGLQHQRSGGGSDSKAY